MKHCIRCGAENSDSSRFCTNCGAPLSLSSTTDGQSQFDNPYAYQDTPNTAEYYEAQIPTYYRTFQSAVHTCLVDKYATFSGRATRSEYWYFGLFNFLVCSGIIFLGVMMAVILRSELIAIGCIVLYGLYLLGVFIPTIAVSARRLHDKGNSGWFLLLQFLPYVGCIVLFVLFILDSQHYDNQYGLAPHEER